MPRLASFDGVGPAVDARHRAVHHRPVTAISASANPTGWLRGPPSNLIIEGDGEQRRYLLEGMPLKNGEEVEIALRGNAGWTPARIEGLPDELEVVFHADDGKALRTTLSIGIQLRWP